MRRVVFAVVVFAIFWAALLAVQFWWDTRFWHEVRPYLGGFQSAERRGLDWTIVWLVGVTLEVVFFGFFARGRVATRIASGVLGLALLTAAVTASGMARDLPPDFLLIALKSGWRQLLTLQALGQALGYAALWAAYLVFREVIGAPLWRRQEMPTPKLGLDSL